MYSLRLTTKLTLCFPSVQYVRSIHNMESRRMIIRYDIIEKVLNFAEPDLTKPRSYQNRSVNYS